MKHRVRILFAAFFLALMATPVHAQPGSINFPTRTDDILGNDFKRIADVAASISSMSGRLAYHMYDIQGANCSLIGGCSQAVQNYVNPLGEAAHALAERARFYYENDVLNDRVARMVTLRTQFFDLVATRQYALRELIRNSDAADSGMGHGDADAYCGYVFDTYWILMNMIVDYPRPAGLGGGRGTDD